MSMYLVSDNELNTIIRLRRQDVLKFLAEVQEQNPQASFDELIHATRHFFAAQAVQFDYLADYTQEEIAYGLVDPEPVAEEELDGAAIVDYAPEPENVDPMTDETLMVVDDTIQIIDEPTNGFDDNDDVTPEPAAVELAPEAPVEEETPEVPAAETSTEVVAIEEENPADAEQREERSNRISLRALQRELRQIDKA